MGNSVEGVTLLSVTNQRFMIWLGYLRLVFPTDSLCCTLCTVYKPIVQKFIAMRNPNKRDWKALHSFYENLMELDDFLALYPELSREQLARVARCSIHVCNRWFMESETRRSPTEAHRLRFSIAHFVWQMEQIEPPDFQELRQIYREMKNK